jgi:asparagine synthase (glutamine-hydrolysing)
MCGILGIVSNESLNISKFDFQSKLDLMTHRGPDDDGIFISENSNVYFGHKRLSILDLSPGGHQPMSCDLNRYFIVFNGEIYNYLNIRNQLSSEGFVFKTHSDTEVVLKSYIKWGFDCVNYFSGMFAFAIYDAYSNNVFIARDRAGEKPLFYSIENNTLSFSSELKPLVKNSSSSNNIDINSLNFYLMMGYVPNEYCIFSGYKKLPPAHALLYDIKSSSTKIWKYWTLPTYSNEFDNLEEDEFVSEINTLLEKSIKQQLCADVPVGVLLSGGVDSSLVTAIASKLTDKVKTFSVRFPGFNKFDETPHARLIANHFKTDHIELNAEDITPDIILHLATQYDEPIIDSSMIPTFLVSQLVRQHCKVVLGGDGADELFGGYNHYGRLYLLNKRLNRIPQNLRKVFSDLCNDVLPIGFKGRNYLTSIGIDFNTETPLIANYFDNRSIELLTGNHISSFSPNDIFQKFVVRDNNFLERALKTDFVNFLAEDILVKVDRASMLNSLEVRSPFLDLNIIEFAFGKVPNKLKVNEKEKKILLKKLAKKLLPVTFELNRKQGFSIPLDDWLKKGKFRDFFYDVLTSKNTYFNSEFSKELLKKQDQGYNNSEKLFGLVLFEIWHKEYFTH